MTTDELSGLISAVAAILATLFSFYQHRNNRGMSKKLEEYKRKLTEKMNRDSESAAIIYGELWDGLHRLGTDRLYILQPHPAHANRFLSITMEVRRGGVSSVKPKIQSLPMSDVPKFVALIARERFISYPDMSVNTIDKRIRAILGVSGVLSMSIHRLENSDGRWIGNIFCEHTQKLCWQCNKCESVLGEMAKVIAPILPDFEADPK